MAHLLVDATMELLSPGPNLRDYRAAPQGPTVLSPGALGLFARFGEHSRSVHCNLTLTHGRGADLVPTARDGFSLWTQNFSLSSEFPGAREDRKSAYRPERLNATIDFLLPVSAGASGLCLLTYGAFGDLTGVSFPGLGDQQKACAISSGYDWAPGLSIYTFDCQCPLPPEVKTLANPLLRLTSLEGKAQIAGVVVW
jgi:hypothetical protein